MVLKRQLRDGHEEGAELPIKRRYSSLFKGMDYGHAMQESMNYLEPIIRKWVQEAVECAIDPFVRSPYAQIECSGSRTLQLQFHSMLAPTMFTGSRIVSLDNSPIKIALYDSASNEVVTSGPLSSVKVSIVVLDGDFKTDDREDWTVNEFKRKLVKNREGKRPLVTGELTVPLQDGVGYIGDIMLTDNSSWIRSGKFRLGAQVMNSGETRIREARSNAFKVKDHRGESYQKHYPPSLGDEVWRLEKIAKEGASHKKLTENGIYTVGDFLRLHFTDHFMLRSILRHIAKRSWDTIITHATSCILDDKMYLFRTAQGTGLLFNSIYMLVGVAFDGQTYQPVNSLNTYQKGMVENLKLYAYRNLQDWVLACEPSIVPAPDTFANSNLLLPDVNVQEPDQQGMAMSTSERTISPSYKITEEQDNSGFMFGESSNKIHGFNPTFRNSFGMNDSLGGFCTEGHHSWASEDNDFAGPQLSTDDLPIYDTLQVKPLWHRNELFLDSCSNHEFGTFSSNNAGIITPRNGTPKTNWCKVLAVVKWRILVRRNVAARKWQCYVNYM